MTKETETRQDAELIDLGSVTAETHGQNSGSQPDLPQPRSQTGVLAD